MRSLSSIDEREQERQLDEEIVTKSIALGLDPFVERSNEFFYTTTATTIASTTIRHTSEAPLRHTTTTILSSTTTTTSTATTEAPMVETVASTSGK